MPQPYNLTNISGTNTLYGFMSEANALADGLIGSLTLLVIWLMFFLAFKKFESKTAFGGASYITALLAILLRILGWIPGYMMNVSILMAGIALLIMWWS